MVNCTLHIVLNQSFSLRKASSSSSVSSGPNEVLIVNFLFYSWPNVSTSSSSSGTPDRITLDESWFEKALERWAMNKEQTKISTFIMIVKMLTIFHFSQNFTSQFPVMATPLVQSLKRAYTPTYVLYMSIFVVHGRTRRQVEQIWMVHLYARRLPQKIYLFV